MFEQGIKKEKDDCNSNEMNLGENEVNIKEEIEEVKLEIVDIHDNDIDESQHSNLSTHLRELEYKCTECRESFKNFTQLSHHSKKNHSSRVKSFKCELCLDVFTQKSDLNLHISSHNSENNNFKCLVCDKEFSTKITLKRHALHRKKKKICKCDQCGKEFEQERLFKKHLEIHISDSDGELSHKCYFCKASFRYRKTLTRHLNEKHQNHLKDQHRNLYSGGKTENVWKIVRCPYCTTDIFSQNLKIHISVIHPEVEVNNDPDFDQVIIKKEIDDDHKQSLEENIDSSSMVSVQQSESGIVGMKEEL